MRRGGARGGYGDIWACQLVGSWLLLLIVIDIHRILHAYASSFNLKIMITFTPRHDETVKPYYQLVLSRVQYNQYQVRCGRRELWLNVK